MPGFASMLLLTSVQLAAALSVTAPVVTPPVPCRIIDARHGHGISEIYATCASTSLRLGQADSYATSLNAPSGQTLVVRQNGVVTNAVLVSQDSSGAPVIQDVSRDVSHVALAAGLPRGARPTIDLTRFAATGTLTLTSAGSAMGAVTKTTTIDLSTRLHTGP